ncbi:hypothetical protein, partial [Streptomyces sp. WAC05950]|uniref:hypothetical protein n=1 Tax=Streptomyces sp. WAC05950 TaxID=2487419 RepID=UPI001C8D0621
MPRKVTPAISCVSADMLTPTTAREGSRNRPRSSIRSKAQRYGLPSGSLPAASTWTVDSAEYADVFETRSKVQAGNAPEISHRASRRVRRAERKAAGSCSVSRDFRRSLASRMPRIAAGAAKRALWRAH